jgi:hypothetical protein
VGNNRPANTSRKRARDCQETVNHAIEEYLQMIEIHLGFTPHRSGAALDLANLREPRQ